MNLRNVLRAYSLLRQLSDDESALLNILRALNDNDREQLVASMSDKPGVKTRPQSEKCGVCNMTRKTSVHSDKRYTDYHEFEKKSSKKSAGGGGGGKSRRGAALGEKIRNNLQQRQPTVGGFADDADMVCAYQYPNDSAVNAGLRCGEGSINGVHDKAMGYAGYHEFVASPTTGKSDAQSAASGS